MWSLRLRCCNEPGKPLQSIAAKTWLLLNGSVEGSLLLAPSDRYVTAIGRS